MKPINQNSIKVPKTIEQTNKISLFKTMGTNLVFGRIGAAQRKAAIQIAARAIHDTTVLKISFIQNLTFTPLLINVTS